MYLYLLIYLIGFMG